MGEAMQQAKAGMALFAKEDEMVFDADAAAAFKAEHEAAIKEKEAASAALTGKDNKKARQVIDKEVSQMKKEEKYIDACKVVKGLAPPNGNFASKKEEAKPEVSAPVEEAAPAVEEKKESKEKKEPKKTVQSAGISKAERDELEKLKKDIMDRKATLKAEGLSGGQCNKDEQVVAWVARMQELKIKEDPTLADAGKKEGKKPGGKALSSEQQKQKETLEAEIETYRQKLISEFGYSKKDIAADPDMMEMQEKLKKMK